MRKSVLFFVASLMLAACGSKQQTSEDIIVEKVVDKPQAEVMKATKPEQHGSIEWVEGNTYAYTISFTSLDTIPAVENYGVKYYDNAITLRVNRADGSEVFTKQLTKSYFASHLSDEMVRHGVFLNLVFYKSDANSLHFVASFGSPDESNDDFSLLQYSVDRFGNSSIGTYTPPTERTADGE